MNNIDQRIAHIKKTLAELRSTTDHTQQLIDDLSLTLDHLRSPGPTAPVDNRGVSRAGAPRMVPAPAAPPSPMQPNPQPPRPDAYPGPRPMQDLTQDPPPPPPVRQDAPPPPPSRPHQGPSQGPPPTRVVQGPPPPPVEQQPQPPLPTSQQGPPPAFVPQGPTRPLKQPLTTEQKVVRAAAVLGSIITFIGASFGVALAIQSGVLGPVGRAIGAFLFALILLGVGLRIDIRRGAQPGVTALYVTSFLVILADLAYITHSQHWLSPTELNVAALTTWVAFLGLALWRNNLWLVLCMCIAYFFFAGLLFDQSVANTLLLMVYPPLALACTWVIPTTKTPYLALTTRLFTAIMLINKLILLSLVTWFESHLAVVSIAAYIGVFLLIAGDRYFPIRQLSPSTRNWTSIYAPAAVILTSYAVVWRISLWVPVVVAIAATILVGLLWSQPRDPAQVQQGRSSLTAWLGILPFTFVPLVFETGAQVEQKMISQSIAVIVFLAAFTALLVLMRYRAAHRVPLLAAWSVALFLVVHAWIPGTMSSSFARFLPAHDLAVGLTLTAFLVFAASQLGLWRSFKPGERNLFAAAGLLFSVVGIVTASTAIGELISPNRYGVTATESKVIPSEEDIYPQGFQVGFFVGHMIVSISWMALAAWLLVKRPKPGTDPRAARVAGLVIAIGATAKLTLFDMASLSGIPRVITFIVCGLLLIAVAVLGAQRNSGETSDPLRVSGPHAGREPFAGGAQQPMSAHTAAAPQTHAPGEEGQAPQIGADVRREPEHGNTTDAVTLPGQTADRRTPDDRGTSGSDTAPPESYPS